MLRLAMIPALLCAAVPARALVCTFRTECYEAEACTDANFTIELSGDSRILMTEFGDLHVDFQEGGEDANTYVSHEGAAIYMLTTYKTGGARLTMHGGDTPLQVSYLGACEELN